MEKTSAGRYKLISFTDVGKRLMLSLRDYLSGGAKTNEQSDNEVAADSLSLDEWTRQNFKKGNILVFIGAVAIAVRAIAPYVKDKTTDPAVIVIDENGAFVIPILSGHIGGAVKASREIAEILGAIPVITTATDVRGEFAIDVFARENNLEISDMKMAKEFTAKLLSGEDAVFRVSPKKHDGTELCLIPRCIVVGMGCKKGKSFEELYEFLCEELSKNNIDERALKALVSIDLKKDEEGLTVLAKKLGIPFITFSPETLMAQEGDFESSEFAKSVTGVDNICERAVAAYGVERIILHKTKGEGMTIAMGMNMKESCKNV